MTEHEAKAQEQVSPVANDVENPLEDDIGHKVFVGNLSFQTTEEELAKFFSSAGKVLQATVISRGSRSLGYGFVAFDTYEEAEKAVNDLNKKELDSREINVEIARPKPEGVTPNEGPRRGRGGRFGGRGRGRGRGGRSGRGGSWTGPRRFSRSKSGPPANAAANETTPNGNSDEQPAEEGADEEFPATHRGRGRRFRGRGRGRGRGSARPARIDESEHEPSKTTLFVGNLPFSLDDDGLRNIFNDYSVTSARVVHRRTTGRSKGFGFVQLASEEEQKRALDNLRGTSVEGRELMIKIARSDFAADEKTGSESEHAGEQEIAA
ncbi:uncharacterized protein VTP21DRAFT_4742 [Calcarisporiella thermophila]|uniref:uncharacterized protein n=1 Tax=Calcarisporiella thermophila TaxID=911321 RepID=UPI003742A8F0